MYYQCHERCLSSERYHFFIHEINQTKEFVKFLTFNKTSIKNHSMSQSIQEWTKVNFFKGFLTQIFLGQFLNIYLIFTWAFVLSYKAYWNISCFLVVSKFHAC